MVARLDFAWSGASGQVIARHGRLSNGGDLPTQPPDRRVDAAARKSGCIAVRAGEDECREGRALRGAVASPPVRTAPMSTLPGSVGWRFSIGRLGHDVDLGMSGDRRCWSASVRGRDQTATSNFRHSWPEVPKSLHIGAHPRVLLIVGRLLRHHETPASGHIRCSPGLGDGPNCHAEGRGFESLQPLRTRSRSRAGSRRLWRRKGEIQSACERHSARAPRMPRSGPLCWGATTFRLAREAIRTSGVLLYLVDVDREAERAGS
jgi:hypothetical protein